MNIKHLEKLIETDKLEEIITLLNEKPILATQITSYQISPVLLACYFKKTTIAAAIANFITELSIFDACALGNFEEVTLAIFKNPSLINVHYEFGFTPLGLACYFSHAEIARFLVLKGADVNIASKNGYHLFPLHSAVLANNLGISKMLLTAGAYPNVCQKDGIAALHTAAQLGNIEMIVLLLEHGADVALTTDEGKLPSDLAAEKGFAEIAEILKIDD